MNLVAALHIKDLDRFLKSVGRMVAYVDLEVRKDWLLSY